MALGPIGNVTYINQNSQLGSIQHANNMQKVDFMLNANTQDFVDKLKAVQEISPSPETQAINPDDKQEKKRERESEKKQSQNSHKNTEALIEEESGYKTQTHLLDIRA